MLLEQSCVVCRFVRTEADDSSDTWEVRMAKKYYAKLFKEYAIADLSRYKVWPTLLGWTVCLNTCCCCLTLDLAVVRRQHSWLNHKAQP